MTASFAAPPGSRADMELTRVRSGLLSDLVLVRMHGRTREYFGAEDHARAAVVARCRAEATVPDLAERILNRSIYAQSSSRTGPLRELLQNAIDASPRGARIDVRSSDDEREVTVFDRGRGMTSVELLENLLVPFRSGKEGDAEAIGEHGVGFFSSLEIAPRIEITTVAPHETTRLALSPASVAAAPHADFLWTMQSSPTPRGAPTGTSIKLHLDRPLPRATLFAEIAAAVSYVDPARHRIYVDEQLVNAARSRLRRVARARIAGGALGEVELFVGKGEGLAPIFVVTQRGLLVSARHDPFPGDDLSLHRDLARAMSAAGYAIIAELPLDVPLTKGRTAPAASASRAVEEAIVTAFERFVIEDALFDRELLRSVDHRLASVLDRLVASALAGDVAAPPEPPPHLADEAALSTRAPIRAPANDVERPLAPTVAAPEEVVRFAEALVDMPMFQVTLGDAKRGPTRARWTLRNVLAAYRAGVLRPTEDQATPGKVALSIADPLAQALWRRLSALAAPPPIDARRPKAEPSFAMQKVAREGLKNARVASGLPALHAAMSILERIDAAISAAASLPPSPITVHQDLYGPDEMAHTDGSGISVNLAAPRVRALLSAVLASDDRIAFAALVDLLLHEKAHVSLASYVPRSTAEHGASFYRRKDWLRRRLIEAISAGGIADPMSWLAFARRGLTSFVLPAPEALALAFEPEGRAA